jgi:hypothetical protein
MRGSSATRLRWSSQNSGRLSSEPATYVAGLAWLPDTSTFADECLLVPTMDLASVAIDGDDRWVLDFHPHSPEKTRLDNYRVPLTDLASRVEAGSSAAG